MCDPDTLGEPPIPVMPHRLGIRVLAIVLASGCTHPPPVEPSTREPAPRVVAPPPTRAEREPSETLSPIETPPLVEPPPLQAIVPVQTGLPADPVITWPTSSDGSGAPVVVLFPDELAAVRRAVAAALTKRGFATVPIAKLEVVEDAAAAGKLVLEGDQRCASPLSRDEVLARYFGVYPRVKIDAACWGECRLSIAIERSETDVQSFTSNRVRHPEDPKAWITAGSQLGDELLGIGGLGLRGTSHNPPIRFSEPSWVGTWPEPPTDPQFSALESRAAACAHPDPMVGLSHIVRARVDRRGRVDRCVAEGPHAIARTADETCLCEVFGDLRFGAGSGKRRFRVEAIDDGFALPVGTLTALQPGTDVWISRIRASLAFEHCAAAHPLAVDLDATVSLQLRPDGSVEQARLDGKIVDRGAMQWARCVIGELEALALPCRPPGIDTLHARLVFAAPAP